MVRASVTGRSWGGCRGLRAAGEGCDTRVAHRRSSIVDSEATAGLGTVRNLPGGGLEHGPFFNTQRKWAASVAASEAFRGQEVLRFGSTSSTVPSRTT